MQELLARISSQELSEWMAFYSLEPWGTEVDDLRAGIIASTIANVNRDPKKRRKPYKAQDFMPVWGGRGGGHEKRQQTAEEQKRIIQMWNALLGGS